MKTVVLLSKLADELKLTNLTPDIDMTKVELTTPDINRPALQRSQAITNILPMSGCRL